MTAKNDITGDSIKSKNNSDAYRDNWDRIFGKKDKTDPCPACAPNTVCRTPACGRLKNGDKNGDKI